MVSTRKPQKILILAANPKQTRGLRLDEELRDIKEGLQRSANRDNFHLRYDLAVRPRDVRRAILDYRPNIIHFSGHGSGMGGLYFEDETGHEKPVTGEALASLFKQFSKQIECVLLNACYSEIQANAIVQHINYVIGMNDSINDKAAIEFAVGFYDAIAAYNPEYDEDSPIEFGFNSGRSAVEVIGLADKLIPMLIKNPNTIPRILSSDEQENYSDSEKISSSKTEPKTELSELAKIVAYTFPLLKYGVKDIPGDKVGRYFSRLQKFFMFLISEIPVEDNNVRWNLFQNAEYFFRTAYLLPSDYDRMNREETDYTFEKFGGAVPEWFDYIVHRFPEGNKPNSCMVVIDREYNNETYKIWTPTATPRLTLITLQRDFCQLLDWHYKNNIKLELIEVDMLLFLNGIFGYIGEISCNPKEKLPLEHKILRPLFRIIDKTLNSSLGISLPLEHQEWQYTDFYCHLRELQDDDEY